MDTTETSDQRLTLPEPIAPSSSYGCGSSDCVDCNGNYAWRQVNCFDEFDGEQTCEYCGEYPESVVCPEAEDGCHWPSEEYDIVLN